jgi:hypothetical protein
MDVSVVPSESSNDQRNEIEEIHAKYVRIIDNLQRENWNTRKELEITRIRLESATIQL